MSETVKDGPEPGANLYSANYYNCYYGRLGPSVYSRENPHWLCLFGSVADEIVRRLKPRKVLDVGCAKGFLVECLRDRGVEACGFDVSEYAIGEVRADVRPYCWVGSAADSIKDDYDLITCIEVCEHLPEPEAAAAVREMTRSADTILFSSTPGDFEEPTHINVHPIIDWLRLFAEFSFAPDEGFDAGFLAPQAILFRRSQSRSSDQALCRFAYVRNRAIYASELKNSPEFRAELDAVLNTRAWRAIRFYRDLRFRVKHGIAGLLDKLNLRPGFRREGRRV
jgi:SAM-dependent methyltransferase